MLLPTAVELHNRAVRRQELVLPHLLQLASPVCGASVSFSCNFNCIYFLVHPTANPEYPAKVACSNLFLLDECLVKVALHLVRIIGCRAEWGPSGRPLARLEAHQLRLQQLALPPWEYPGPRSWTCSRRQS